MRRKHIGDIFYFLPISCKDVFTVPEKDIFLDELFERFFNVARLIAYALGIDEGAIPHNGTHADVVGVHERGLRIVMG